LRDDQEKEKNKRKKEDGAEVGVETGGDANSHEVSLATAGRENIRAEP